MWQTPQWLAPDPPFGPDRKRAPVGGGSRVGCAGLGPAFSGDVRKTCRCLILRGGPRWANSHHSALRPKGAASPCQEQDPTSTTSTGGGGRGSAPPPHARTRGSRDLLALLPPSAPGAPPHPSGGGTPPVRWGTPDAHAGMRDGGAASSAEPDQEAGSPVRARGPSATSPRSDTDHQRLKILYGQQASL